MTKFNQKTENPIPKEVFEILACPLCKSDVRYTKNKKGLVCVKCHAKYEIDEGIPIMLPPSQRKSSK